MIRYGQAMSEVAYVADPAPRRGTAMTIVNCVTRRSEPLALHTSPSVCPSCGQGNRLIANTCQQCGRPAGDAQSCDPARPAARAPLRYDIAARSDRGRMRATNQDTIYTGELVLPGGGSAYLCLVADGMGGAQAGELASRMAAAVTLAQIQARLGLQPPPDDAAWLAIVREATSAANRRVYDAGRAHAAQRGMGTTLVIALIVANRAYIAS